jgi:hypothetical protein
MPDAGEAIYYEVLGILEAAAAAGDEVAEAARKVFVETEGNLQATYDAAVQMKEFIAIEGQLREGLKQLGIQFEGTREELFAFVESMGGLETAAEALNEFSRISGVNVSKEMTQFGDAFEQVFKELGLQTPKTIDEFVAVVQGFYDMGQAGAATAVQLSLLSDETNAYFTALEAFSNGLNYIGVAFEGTQDEIETFIDAMGGVDMAMAAIAEFSRLGSSDTVQNLVGFSIKLEETFTDLGLAVPKTVGEFKDVVLEFYEMGEAGAKTAAELSLLSDEIKEFYDTIMALERGYQADFYTPEEQVNEEFLRLKKTLNDLGVAMPTTAEGFRRLVESIDTSTKEGMELYLTLLEISPQMAAFYNSLDSTGQSLKIVNGVLVIVEGTVKQVTESAREMNRVLNDWQQAWVDWQDVRSDLNQLFSEGADSTVDNLGRYLDLLSSVGIESVPTTGKELHKEASGGWGDQGWTPGLTQEQLTLLGKNVDLIREAFQELQQVGDWVEGLRGDVGGQAALDKFAAMMHSFGVETVPQNEKALYDLIQAGGLTQKQIIALYRESDTLSAAWKHLAETTGEAGDALDELRNIISAIEGAVGTFAEVQQDVINLDYERAKRQLEMMARESRWGNLPSSEALGGVLDRLTAGAASRTFTSSREEGAANARMRANLELIGSKAEDQLTEAERQIDLLENTLEVNNQQLAVLESINENVTDGYAISAGYSYDTGSSAYAAPEGTLTPSQEIAELRRESKQQWEAMNVMAGQMYASLRAQEARSNKWDKDGLPPPRDLDNKTVNIIAMQGR